MNQTKFAVSRFENRNGSTSWRVDGRLHGVRIRRNFRTKEEAAAEKAALELKALGRMPFSAQIGRPSPQEKPRRPAQAPHRSASTTAPSQRGSVPPVNPEDYLNWVLPKLAAGTNQNTAGLLPHDYALLLKEPRQSAACSG